MTFTQLRRLLVVTTLLASVLTIPAARAFVLIKAVSPVSPTVSATAAIDSSSLVTSKPAVNALAQSRSSLGSGSATEPPIGLVLLIGACAMFVQSIRKSPWMFVWRTPSGSRGDEVEVLDVPVLNVSRENAVSSVMTACHERHRQPVQVSFANAHCVNVAAADPEYMRILHETPFVFPDGIGVKIGARLAGVRLQANVNGTDLFPLLCQAMEREERAVYLLGARPGVVEKVRARLARDYPGLRLAGFHHGYFTPQEEPALIDEIASSGADVLFVAMGVPVQEKWIARHRDRLGVRVAIGVGALFDFYSRQMPRAPRWMRKYGLEWLYRLYREPRRMWNRYVVGNPVFLARAVGRKILPLRLETHREAIREGIAAVTCSH